MPGFLFTLCLLINGGTASSQDCDYCDRDWAERATPKIIRDTFDSGVSPNGTNRYGGPLVFLVAYMSKDAQTIATFYEEAAKTGVELKVVSGDPPYFDGTILHQAARNDDPGVLTFLLKKDTNPNWRDDRSATPLMAAAKSNNPETFRLLLEAGADPNAKDGQGWTAAHHVASSRRSNPDIIDVLAEYGASLDEKSNNGLTPYLMAKSNNADRLVERLNLLLPIK